MAAQAPPPVPVTSNPSLDMYSNQMNNWSGDQSLAYGAQSGNNLNSLTQQQTQLLGNGGVGYTAGGGNDQSGSSYSQANPWAISTASSGVDTTNYSQDPTQAPPPAVEQTPGLYTPHQMNQTSYPTYPNSYGLGSQTGGSGASPAPTGPTPSTGSYGTPPAFNPGSFQSIVPQTQMPANPYGGDAQAYYPGNSGPQPSSTTGFNPWSMTGEANSRVM